MAVSSRIHIPWEDINSSLPSAIPGLPIPLDLTTNPIPYAVTAILILVVIVSVHVHSSSNNGHKKVPVLNPKGPFELTTARTRHEYDMNSWDMMYQGMRKYPDQPFRILSGELQDIMVLPPRYANEIKNDDRFSFASLVTKSFHGNLPGFGTFNVFSQPNKIVQTLVQQDITRALPKLTEPLSRETDTALRETLTDSTDWHDVNAKQTVFTLVTRLSTLAFMGADMCHDKEWIDVTVNFAVEAFLSAKAVSTYPRWLQPFANLYLVPRCRDLRALEAKARSIIDSELEKRRVLKAEAENNNVELEFHDVLEWSQKYSNVGGTFDPTLVQLGISFVAIHTSTDLLSQVVLDLAEHQELLEPLRREITECLSGGEGISKASLHHMMLLDSVIKESQRLKPAQVGLMEREVLEDVTLLDGIHLKRGSGILVTSPLRDPAIYENPDEYDGYRFYRIRQQPGKKNTAQLVTTSLADLAFGYGQHTCPGRFFAVHELKIVLCHLLLKYDIKLVEGAEKPHWSAHGNNLDSDNLARVVIRRREVSEAEDLL
ncbi:hypothetical protein VMCG_07263 [Cytospora schulzeri]|uniref:Cytochrome P450 n=1 Tax=Cytospora schulzeri TaxID=448051 RepID=A0A423WAH6_9PEZI|nr:hypothetical protein VMCG_07263 [Valsa malicola]